MGFLASYLRFNDRVVMPLLVVLGLVIVALGLKTGEVAWAMRIALLLAVVVGLNYYASRDLRRRPPTPQHSHRCRRAASASAEWSECVCRMRHLSAMTDANASRLYHVGAPAAPDRQDRHEGRAEE